MKINQGRVLFADSGIRTRAALPHVDPKSNVLSIEPQRQAEVGKVCRVFKGQDFNRKVVIYITS